MELRAKNSRTINAEFVGALSWWRIHHLPSHNSSPRDTISQMLQNLHVESCLESFTLRCEFVVRNSMAVKKTINMLWFWICFSVIISVLANLSVSTLYSVTSARCHTRRSTIRRLWWPFPRIHRFPLRFSSQRNNLSVASFAQEGAVSAQSWRKTFAIILTVNRRSLSTREWTRSMFSLPLEVEGRLTLHRPWAIQGLPENAGPTWKQFFPLGHTLHKTVATFDEFHGHSCPVSQETWC